MSTYQGYVIPPSHVLIKKGGRPAKKSRDAAILLARFWRVKCLQETAKSADEWIVKNFEGLTDTRHVRTRINIAQKQTFLGPSCNFVLNEALFLTNDGCITREDPNRRLNEEWFPLERLPDLFDRKNCCVLAYTGLQACMWNIGQKQAHLARMIPLTTDELMPTI